MKNLKYIYRVENDSMNGWIVHFCGKSARVCRNRFFSVMTFGGIRRSREAAVAYRDQSLEQAGLLHLIKVSRVRSEHIVRSASNRSGIIGVYRFVQRRVLNSGRITKLAYWIGNGMVDKAFWKRGFSIQKYGEIDAFKYACRERYRRHGDLHVVGDIQQLPCVPDVPHVIAGQDADIP